MNSVPGILALEPSLQGVHLLHPQAGHPVAGSWSGTASVSILASVECAVVTVGTLKTFVPNGLAELLFLTSTVCGSSSGNYSNCVPPLMD